MRAKILGLVCGLAMLSSPLVASGQCAGNCNGDFDGSRDVTVDEVIVAINNALNGCEIEPTETPTPTPTPTATVVPTPTIGDLVVNNDATVAGGKYRNILVKNGSRLVVEGDLEAQDIVAQSGAMIVNGSVIADTVMMAEGSLAVYGNDNTATSVTIGDGGVLHFYGEWSVVDFLIDSGGTASLVVIDDKYPGSGTLNMVADTVTIAGNGVLSAYGAGHDPRGKGGGWYRNSGGGGYGGQGGRGYWNATNRGPVFGEDYTYEISMGGEGGYRAGGAINIESREMTIEGTLSSDGRGEDDSTGGGAGGGVLLHVEALTISGFVSANGGTGGCCETGGGGGGGGRIKIFYDNLTLIGEENHFSVTGGQRGGFLNTQNGGIGSVWIDVIPEAPTLLEPQNNEQVGRQPSFSFTVVDNSDILDDRVEDLSAIIEVSADGFETVQYTFDQDVSLGGWSQLFYRNGDKATFEVEDNMIPGRYEWRARIRDRSLGSLWSEPSSFEVH
jgi:hypothetical protein